MNTQELFDTIVIHLLNQNQKSLHITGDGCLYRGPNGLKCAVGIVIPDEIYTASIEEKCVEAAFERLSENLPKYLADNIDLLSALQTVHDECEISEWVTEFYDIAEFYDLNTEVLKAWTKE